MFDALPTVVDALVHPEETAAWAASLPPQAVDREALEALTPEVLSQDGRIDALVALERQMSMLAARSVELLAAIAAHAEGSTDPREEFTRDAVAIALRVPPASMTTQLHHARQLADRLPATMRLLRAGDISYRHAITTADATASLSGEQVAEVEAHVMERAPEQTVAQLRISVRRAVLRASDVATQERAHRAAVADRRVVITPAEDGMSVLWALLPTPAAASIGATLDAMAYSTVHGKGGDPRTADQRRADALVDLASTVLAGDSLTRGHRQRPAVAVTIAASTLAGADEQAGEIDGYGPITAAMARRVAADDVAEWTLMLTDDDGHVIAVGTQTYRPTVEMIRLVLARDRHCTFPGCRRPAGYCDLDHRESWRPGDLTSIANLHALCRQHHRAKHAGRWTIRHDRTTGVTTWSDRRGRSYRSRPPSRPTTATTDRESGTAANPLPTLPDDPPF